MKILIAILFASVFTAIIYGLKSMALKVFGEEGNMKESDFIWIFIVFGITLGRLF